MNKKLLSIFVALVLALTAMLPMSVAGAEDYVLRSEFTEMQSVVAILETAIGNLASNYVLRSEFTAMQSVVAMLETAISDSVSDM